MSALPSDSPTAPPAARFTLFVAGDSPRSRQALHNVRQLGERLGAGVEVEVVDVTRDPARAERERILTTPTLLKAEPAPPRRVTGDLSDLGRVLVALGLDFPEAPSLASFTTAPR